METWIQQIRIQEVKCVFSFPEAAFFLKYQLREDTLVGLRLFVAR